MSKSILRMAMLLLLTGCALGRQSYSILNLSIGKSVAVRPVSQYRELIIDTDDQSKSFRTFSRDTDNGFLIRSINYQGTVLLVNRIPCFSQEYIDSYVYEMGFAVSPNGLAVAFLDESTSELRLFDVKTKTSHVLTTNLAKNKQEIAFLQWVSSEALVVGVNNQHANGARILLLNTQIGGDVLELKVQSLRRFVNSVSMDKRYLAYWEGLSRNNIFGVFRLYDLKARREIATIGSKDHFFNGPPFWSPDNEHVAFISEGQLMRYSLISKQVNILKRFTDDQVVSLRGYSGKRAFYCKTLKDSPSQDGALFVLDLASEQESMIKGTKTNGKVLVVGDGTFVISGWGF